MADEIVRISQEVIASVNSNDTSRQEITRVTSEVTASPNSLGDAPAVALRSTAEVIASPNSVGGAPNQLVRSAPELIAEADEYVQGLDLPNIQVQDQTIFFVIFLVDGSRFNISPKANTYGGIVIEPSGIVGEAVIRYYEPETGAMYETESLAIYEKNLMVSLKIAVSGEVTLFVNQNPIPISKQGFIEASPLGITYSEIVGLIPFYQPIMDAQMSELIVFNSLVSDHNMTVVEDYLYCKWFTEDGATPENNYCIPRS